MRVHELANEAGLSNLEMLQAIRRMGVEARNHMTTLDDADVALIRAAHRPSPVKSVDVAAAPEPPPLEQSVEVPAAPQTPTPKSSWLQVADEPFNGVTLRRRSELDYRHFQKEAIAFMATRHSVLLADEMGLGKTIEAIGAINSTDANRVLIVCPAFLRLNWKNELEKWLIRFSGRPIELLADNNYYKLRANGSFIAICSYTMLHTFQHVLAEIPWDIVIGDEAHKIKNAESLQSRAFRKLKSNRRILMTGTPILNRVDELWPMLDWLHPGQWDAKQDIFASRWSHPEGMDQLNRLLTDRIMLRRRKRDVLKELPPKQRQVIEFPLEGGLEIAIRDEMRQCDELETRRLVLEKAVEEAKLLKTDAEYRQALTNLREWHIQRRAALSRIRHTTARIKEPYVTRHIKLLMENEGKVLCFAYHRDVVERIAKHFGKSAVFIHGEISMKERERLVRQFQTDPDTRLFVGGMGSSGQGITLTAASTVVFAELDWTPAHLTQCEDRAHRIGQEADSVLCQYLVADRSIDARLATYLVRKQDIIDRTIDGDQVEMEEELIDRVVWASVAKRAAEDFHSDFQRERVPAPVAPPPSHAEPAEAPKFSVRGCHEAGHVLAYWKQGYPVESATATDGVSAALSVKTVTPLKEWVMSRKIDSTSGIPDAAACHLATAILAGRIAEEMLIDQRDCLSPHTQDDNTFLDTMLAASGMPPEEARQWLAWRETVTRRILEENIKPLKSLADQLSKSSVLNGDTIAEALSGNILPDTGLTRKATIEKVDMPMERIVTDRAGIGRLRLKRRD